MAMAAIFANASKTKFEHLAAIYKWRSSLDIATASSGQLFY